MTFRSLLASSFLISLLSFPVHAACTNPAGVEGEQIYNSTYDMMQFCNGSNQWVNMGSGGGITTNSSSMQDGWPDTIVCNSGADNVHLYLTNLSANPVYETPHSALGATRTYIVFDGSGNYSSQSSLAGYDCVTNTWSISDLYSQGKAFNFIGGGNVWSKGSGGVAFYNGGNVGIGTTNPQNPMHSYLAAGGPAQMKIEVGDGAAGYFSFKNNTNEWFLGQDSTETFSIYDITDSSARVFGIAASAGSNALYINSSGNVGIGTTGPTQKLDVAGTIKSTGSLYVNGNGYFGQDNTATIIYGSTGADDYLGLYAAPDANLGARILLYGRGASNGSVYINSNYNSSNTTNQIIMQRRTSAGASNALMYLRANGDAVIYGSAKTCWIGTGTGTTACTSDARLKNTVKTIPNALDKISAIRGVTYRWNEDANLGDPNQDHLGVIAQEVEAVLPLAVGEFSHDKSIPADIPEGERVKYKHVAMDSLVPVLIEAVKELKNQNEAMQAEIDALKAAQ